MEDILELNEMKVIYDIKIYENDNIVAESGYAFKTVLELLQKITDITEIGYVIEIEAYTNWKIKVSDRHFKLGWGVMDDEDFELFTELNKIYKHSEVSIDKEYPLKWSI